MASNSIIGVEKVNVADPNTNMAQSIKVFFISLPPVNFEKYSTWLFLIYVVNASPIPLIAPCSLSCMNDTIPASASCIGFNASCIVAIKSDIPLLAEAMNSDIFFPASLNSEGSVCLKNVSTDDITFAKVSDIVFDMLAIVLAIVLGRSVVKKLVIEEINEFIALGRSTVRKFNAEFIASVTGSTTNSWNVLVNESNDCDTVSKNDFKKL